MPLKVRAAVHLKAKQNKLPGWARFTTVKNIIQIPLQRLEEATQRRILRAKSKLRRRAIVQQSCTPINKRFIYHNEVMSDGKFLYCVSLTPTMTVMMIK
ncbi:hypothetical protein T09_1449 [Trichinella sp. T9]|nr:hypothetical protein T09_1449 [Trichinella sp. T9]